MSSSGNSEKKEFIGPPEDTPITPIKYAAHGDDGRIKKDADGNTVYQDAPSEKHSSYFPYQKELEGHKYPWTKEQRAEMSNVAQLMVVEHYQELEQKGVLPAGEADKALKSGVPDMYAVHKYRDGVAKLAGIPDRDHYQDIDLTKKDAPYSDLAQKYMKSHNITPEMLNDPATKAQTQLDVQNAFIDSYGSPLKYDEKMKELDKPYVPPPSLQPGQKLGVYTEEEKKEQIQKTSETKSNDNHFGLGNETTTATKIEPKTDLSSKSHPTVVDTPAPHQFSGIDLTKYGNIGFAGQNTMTHVEPVQATTDKPKETVVTQEVQEKKAANLKAF